MIVLGIDPGTARMGYGVVEYFPRKKEYKLVLSNCLETKSDLEPHDRLVILYNGLQRLMKEIDPEVVVIEKLFFNTNVKTAMTVGQARGVSLLAAALQKSKIYEYTALEAKMALTGYGRSDKKQMQEAVKTFFQLEKILKPDDANDAVAMALCYLKKTYENAKN